MNDFVHKRRKARGFTLVEIFIVLAIAVALGISLVAAWIIFFKKPKAVTINPVTTLTLVMTTMPKVNAAGNALGTGVATVLLNVTPPAGTPTASSTVPLPAGAVPAKVPALTRTLTVAVVPIDPLGPGALWVTQNSPVTGATGSVIYTINSANYEGRIQVIAVDGPSQETVVLNITIE